MDDERRPVHLFDAYAMANMRLCSPSVSGTKKSLGIPTMSRNCGPHLRATIQILEPTLCIVQGTEAAKALVPLMTRRRRLGPHFEQVGIAGVSTFVAAFTHPSAWGPHGWGNATSTPVPERVGRADDQNGAPVDDDDMRDNGRR